MAKQPEQEDEKENVSAVHTSVCPTIPQLPCTVVAIMSHGHVHLSPLPPVHSHLGAETAPFSGWSVKD